MEQVLSDDFLGSGCYLSHERMVDLLQRLLPDLAPRISQNTLNLSIHSFIRTDLEAITAQFDGGSVQMKMDPSFM